MTMMLLSGYTLGFFFPKQALNSPKSQGKPEIDIEHDREAGDLARTRPDADFESREIPAAHYFYRYF
jgi:hypothetical protein